MSADVLTEHSPYPDSLRNREWNEDVGEGLCLNPWESSDFYRRWFFRWENFGGAFGYYTNYMVGAQWVPSSDGALPEPKIVLPKITNLDFGSLISACFFGFDNTDITSIFTIDFKGAPIESAQAYSMLTPLLAAIYLRLLENLLGVGFKKDYVSKTDSLSKVKGKILWADNLRHNANRGRDHRLVCRYGEYTVDTPQNRLLKSALVICSRIVGGADPTVGSRISKCLNQMSEVSDDYRDVSIALPRTHKIFRHYSEALKMAKCILRFRDYSLSKSGSHIKCVPPFWIDMPLLFERYVLGLLYSACPESIKYQLEGKTGFPDFLHTAEKLILDAKYIPDLGDDEAETYIVRQLAGYSRDNIIREALGVGDDEIVRCVLIYPERVGRDEFRKCNRNPFKQAFELIMKPSAAYNHFYTIAVPVPLLV